MRGGEEVRGGGVRRSSRGRSKSRSKRGRSTHKCAAMLQTPVAPLATFLRAGAPPPAAAPLIFERCQEPWSRSR